MKSFSKLAKKIHDRFSSDGDLTTIVQNNATKIASNLARINELASTISNLGTTINGLRWFKDYNVGQAYNVNDMIIDGSSIYKVRKEVPENSNIALDNLEYFVLLNSDDVVLDLDDIISGVKEAKDVSKKIKFEDMELSGKICTLVMPIVYHGLKITAVGGHGNRFRQSDAPSSSSVGSTKIRCTIYKDENTIYVPRLYNKNYVVLTPKPIDGANTTMTQVDNEIIPEYEDGEILAFVNTEESNGWLMTVPQNIFQKGGRTQAASALTTSVTPNKAYIYIYPDKSAQIEKIEGEIYIPRYVEGVSLQVSELKKDGAIGESHLSLSSHRTGVKSWENSYSDSTSQILEEI